MISTKVYFTVFVALILFTLTTAGVAFVNLGGTWNVVLALTIAVAKAALVMLYFMHLRYSSYLTLLFAGAGIFWLGILIVLTLTDYVSRGW
jgi:cytochrome c oxidase subunit 4